MSTKKNRAVSIVKAITALSQEFDEAKTNPNVVLMTHDDFKSVQESFPYMVEGNSTLIYNSKRFQVIFTAQKATVGLALSFHTDFAESF